MKPFGPTSVFDYPGRPLPDYCILCRRATTTKALGAGIALPGANGLIPPLETRRGIIAGFEPEPSPDPVGGMAGFDPPGDRSGPDLLSNAKKNKTPTAKKISRKT